MAVLKHIKSKNANYSDAIDYLLFQHDENNGKKILDDSGRPILREEYYIDGLLCTPESFDKECEITNKKFHKNQNASDIKSHHYIISYDPTDVTECGLTGEKAQALSLALAKKIFPGYQALIVTHTDGHNKSGNIHTHIVINSVRKCTAERAPYMSQPHDHEAGYKHRATDKFTKYFKKEIMDMCQEHGLHQVDLLIPAKIKITDKEWLIIDMLILASFVAIFTIIYFMPENTAIVYPICLASIFSSFGCMYLAAYIHDSMQTAYRVQQMETQRDYYKERIAEEERVRSIYHDLKNHLLVMESRQNVAETRQMAETLRSQIADYEDYVHTGNEFLDIILKDKAAKAREKQIDFSALVDFKGMDFIEPLDISTIFGNAIDNAMEASERLPEDQRLITVKAERVRDMLIITVENNTLPGTQPAKGTTKKDRFVHGFGIPNIKKAVEKYDGQCSFRQEDGTYLLKILIPIP